MTHYRHRKIADQTRHDGSECVDPQTRRNSPHEAVRRTMLPPCTGVDDGQDRQGRKGDRPERTMFRPRETKDALHMGHRRKRVGTGPGKKDNPYRDDAKNPTRPPTLG